MAVFNSSLHKNEQDGKVSDYYNFIIQTKKLTEPLNEYNKQN